MKSVQLVGSILAIGLAISTPNLVLAHVGHGDEFQAEGGVDRVPVNPETDPILGIQVTPIETAADGSAAVLIPITALVEADEKQLVFVQYENFYEPVPVTTGATQGERIEITSGLSVGEQLVTQGSLSLYAESRKTQTPEAVTESATEPTTEPATEAASPANMSADGPTETATSSDLSHAEADAQGIPHGHDQAGNLVAADATATTSAQSKVGKIAVGIGGLALLATGIFVVLKGDRQPRKPTFSSKEGDL